MDKKLNRRQLIKGGIGFGVTGALLGPHVALGGGENGLYRWDIANVGFPPPLCAEPGGNASSKSLDNARITVTGSGTFRDGAGHSQNVTGGGTWVILPPAPGPGATPGGSGTFEVVHFIDFVLAPGTLPFPSCIEPDATPHAGRATLGILFSDGEEGVLEIGCRLAGSPAGIMEGITATKKWVTFWNHEEPVPNVEGNRTLFHRLR